MKKILKTLSLLFCALSLFNCLSISLDPSGKFPINVSFILCLVIMFVYILDKPKYYFSRLLAIIKYNKNPLHYLFIFLIISTTSSLLVIFPTLGLNFTKFLLYLIAFILQIFCAVWFSYEIIMKIKHKIFMKVLFGTFYIVLILGVFDFVVNFLNISALNHLLYCFHTRWIFVPDAFNEKVFIGIYPRIQSIFDEPNQLGSTIFMYCPIIYSILITQKKLYKNIIINSIVRYTFIPLLLFNIIGTFSPMMIILFIIISIAFIKQFVKLNIRSMMATFVFLVVISVLTYIIFFLEPLESNNVISPITERITKVFESFGSFESFIEADASIATRVCVSVNNIALGLKHPILGVGFGQCSQYMAKQFMQSPIPLTIEVIMKVNKGVLSYSGFIYKIFCEGGIVGLIPFLLFFFKIFKNLPINKNYLNSVQKIFCNGILLSVIAVFLMLLYDMPFSNFSMWFILGLAIAFSYKVFSIKPD